MMSSSPVEASPPASPPGAPLRSLHTPQQSKRSPQPPLHVILPANAPATPPPYVPGEPTLTPVPRSPGAGDGRAALDGTSSDKSSETAVGGPPRARTPSASGGVSLSRKESYKAQRQHYRREKKRAASALLHSIEDPSVIVLADWLKVRGSLKSWTKLWCVLKPGLLLLYKSPKAKSSHWVGTVLLTSCQVIERPSKKDGFCFKLYHPLEQSIWAPRGPHNETIGAVVQPLPTAHLIFRAPSQAAGHCWLDGLELALRCSNAMLRCSRGAARVLPPDGPAETPLSHEELESHFAAHDYSPNYLSPERERTKHEQKKTSKWSQFIETLDLLVKDHDSSSDSSDEKKEHSFLDCFLKRDSFDRNSACHSSMRDESEAKIQKITSKSLMSSPLKDLSRRTPILKCLEIQEKKIKDKLSPTFIEENLFKLVSALPKRRSSTPTPSMKLSSKRIRELRGSKTDSENDDFTNKLPKEKELNASEVICTTPDNFVITKTAPSIERFRRYSSSSTDEVCDGRQAFTHSPERFSLIDCTSLPSANFEAIQHERRDERFSSQNVYVAGRVVNTGTGTSNSELAGAASDSELSDAMPEASPKGGLTVETALRRIEQRYSEDPDTDLGASGELIEEVTEENKSLLWFLMKQVRPGMDLSKVVLPTFILEPRSFLDRLSDSYYHANILADTQKQADPYERFKTVVRWYLSGLYKKPRGLKKPYNPVLGETFRCCWKSSPTDIIYYVSEQVSHHPPVSAFYVSNRQNGFVIEGSLLARSKFYGNSTSAILEGCARVFLLPWKETYITTAPYAHCKGIVIGTLSMELGGKVHVICEETGYQADIEFKLRSFLGGSDQTNCVSGRIKKGKETVANIDGYWDGRIEFKDKKSGTEQTLLDVAVLKEQRLPRFLVNIDQQTEFESAKLWLDVTVAINADDQVAATTAKTIIEEGQRTRARNLTGPWKPRYFSQEEGRAPEGIIDQGWRYNHSNINTWQPEEKFEYEEDYVISSICSSGAPPPPRVPSLPGVPPRDRSSLGPLPAHPRPPSSHRLSDTDEGDELARRSITKTSTRTLKHSLLAIDSALRDQTAAIDRLTRKIENISERQNRYQNIGRINNSSHSWDILGGFVLAVVLQALLNWMFYQKD